MFCFDSFYNEGNSMRNIAVLGSTGSVGTSALEVIGENLDKFSIYTTSYISKLFDIYFVPNSPII